MNSRKSKTVLTGIGFVALASIFFGVLSQLYSVEQQVFITDSYFINPKRQPFHFVLMWLLTIAALVMAINVGKLIAAFLWSRGLLFLIVGGCLFFGAIFLAYFTIYLRLEKESLAGLITMGLIVMFLGAIGAAMVVLPLLNKTK